MKAWKVSSAQSKNSYWVEVVNLPDNFQPTDNVSTVETTFDVQEDFIQTFAATLHEHGVLDKHSVVVFRKRTEKTNG